MYRVLLPLVSLLLVSCQTTDPSSAATSPYPTLAPLVAQVIQARDAQSAAAAQFQSAQAQLSQLTNDNGGDPQALYAASVAEHDDCVQASIAMSTAIDALEQTANALFQQWQIETQVYTEARLKAENQAKLTQTWQSYEGLIQGLRHSTAQVDPVLAALNTTVMSLRDNLGSGAAATRQVELGALQNDIAALVQQLESGIAQSDAFIASTQG